MLYEDLRLAHEDIERLEDGIADRILDNSKQVSHDCENWRTRLTAGTKNRTRLAREHEIAVFLARITEQSERALDIYKQKQDERIREIQSIATGDTLDSFYRQLSTIKEFHKRNPGQSVENLERAYLRPERGGTTTSFAGDFNSLFTGEEAFGRFFDLTLFHDEYLNLPGIRNNQRLSYLQYLDLFDEFTPPQCAVSRSDKLTDSYFAYIQGLADYLESFLRKIKPLDDLEKLFTSFNAQFDEEWSKDSVPGWQLGEHKDTVSNGITTQSGEGIWCEDCKKEFSNDSTYRSHLTGKKHLRNADTRKHGSSTTDIASAGLQRPKERAVAEREFKVRKLAATMQTVRTDTRNNVERKAGMTERERQQELEMMYAEEDEDEEMADEAPPDDEDENGEKFYNPLKLPLAWDGKPIPFWLYKLHGLGVEFTCEICGNYVYRGRRAFEKHFSEARHVYGLKCLGITNTTLFREITHIKEAEDLWAKIQHDKGDRKDKQKDIVEMEDYSGTVMPLAVYEDLAKEGLL